MMPLNIDTTNCEIICDYCGDRTTKTCKSIHNRKYEEPCKASQIIPRPMFVEWLVTQDYKMLSEYKPLFKELLGQTNQFK